MSEEVKGTGSSSGKDLAVGRVIKVFIALLIVLVTVVWAAVTGVFSSKPEGITVVGEAQYQYAAIDTGEIIVDYSGFKEDGPLSEYGGEYLLPSSCYTGSSLTVYVGGKPLVAELPNYVKAGNVTWLYNGGTSIPSNVGSGVLENPGLVTCRIEYEDGAVRENSAEYVSLSWGGGAANATILLGGVTFYASFDAGSAETSGDAGVVEEGTVEDTEGMGSGTVELGSENNSDSTADGSEEVVKGSTVVDSQIDYTTADWDAEPLDESELPSEYGVYRIGIYQYFINEDGVNAFKLDRNRMITDQALAKYSEGVELNNEELKVLEFMYSNGLEDDEIEPILAEYGRLIRSEFREPEGTTEGSDSTESTEATENSSEGE